MSEIIEALVGYIRNETGFQGEISPDEDLLFLLVCSTPSASSRWPFTRKSVLA